MGSRFESDELRARTDGLRRQVDGMMSTYEQQLRDIAAAKSTLATVSSQGWSDDSLVRVTVNGAGIPIDVWVDAGALKRSTPEGLAASFLRAAQSAARSAKADIDTLLAPVREAAAEFGPPEQVYEHLPFVGALDDILPPPPEPAAPAPEWQDPGPLDDEDEGPHWKGLGANRNGW
ncbi:YbaB/EbfC family nucleoid-associated protein [Nocardia noduli]|uniref:YbaB/EbfC family nucleoid-associated protein n=1 Tax=Nocardia noduli TaxID=2815722 RepID=UPI001C2146D5|nr:YbaB/EbfC family nucleoid-associated protein [Nocardia noduli]